MKLRFCPKLLRNRSILISLQLPSVILLLCTIAPSVIAQSEIHYSDQYPDDSVEDEVKAVGVAITETDYQGDVDFYIVEARLQSPSGQTASASVNGFTSARAEVAMSWNLSFGSWFFSSFHRGVYEQCFWDSYGGYQCSYNRVLLAYLYDNADYNDEGEENLLYRKDGQRILANYCNYVICTIHENSFCASGRRGITRYDGGGAGLNSCPDGYERVFIIWSFRGYRLYCWERKSQARFLSYNPC